jgi:nucleoside-diphosphate-sugar epimerase
MRVLIIGGTGFIGSYVLLRLLGEGDSVAVFHRGQSGSDLPREALRIIGDRRRLADYGGEFDRFGPQVVLDMIPYVEEDARALMATFRGKVERVVALSSQDVYRAYGLFLRLEEGELEPTPYDEDAPLRTRLFPYRNNAQGGEDLAYHYDKIPVERVVMSDPQTPFTILRLPKVYGPGDRSRLFDYLKRMDDGRESILLGERKSRWRWTRGYVENVAAAIAVAVTDARAVNRIYNLGEGDALSESEWARNIGLAAGWSGEVVAAPEDALPQSMLEPYRFEQRLVADTNRFRKELDYEEETPRQEALRRSIEWERANPPPEIDLKRFDYAAEDAALKQIPPQRGA